MAHIPFGYFLCILLKHGSEESFSLAFFHTIMSTVASTCVKCQNGGVCKDEKCQCVYGYIGDHCEKTGTAKIVFLIKLQWK